jgi:hypothetical protein
MRTTTSDPPRPRVARKACGLALAVALAHGATGCAHQQLTNAEVATGVIAAAVIAGAIMLNGVHCNELTSQCRSGEATTGPLTPGDPPPLTGPRAIPGR